MQLGESFRYAEHNYLAQWLVGEHSKCQNGQNETLQNQQPEGVKGSPALVLLLFLFTDHF